VPRIWAPGRPRTTAVRFCSFSTSVVIAYRGLAHSPFSSTLRRLRGGLAHSPLFFDLTKSPCPIHRVFVSCDEWVYRQLLRLPKNIFHEFAGKNRMSSLSLPFNPRNQCLINHLPRKNSWHTRYTPARTIKSGLKRRGPSLASSSGARD
jgi:hypothetical protein